MPKNIERTIAKIPRQDRERVLMCLNEFKINPWQGDIAKIKGGDNLWRRRIGNYRIFYSIDVAPKIVKIKILERRTSSTY
ncbi:MAG: type II toxin-antitoxin system RelE/ParE family toxin [Parcubacteria group bacterium]|nr:type II toxin-antitoxin system RelE/ParE family toxin [Parcubacteria group bacterium]